LREAGTGSAPDVLAFAAIVSAALVLLAAASPQFADAGEIRLAMETARGIVLATGTLPVGELESIVYGIGLPPFFSSIELKDRTIAQLVGECWILYKSRISPISNNMEESLRMVASDIVDSLVGERFYYRWMVEVLGADDNISLFVVTVEDLCRKGRFLCLYSALIPYSPVFDSSLNGLMIRVSVELWSK